MAKQFVEQIIRNIRCKQTAWMTDREVKNTNTNKDVMEELFS